ncbi:MAG: rod shape-determining protein RodA [Cyclobacteriaceae bacterium]|nr:rod shape-determining protein RodA [Cyclobacteriaceae bacterium]
MRDGDKIISRMDWILVFLYVALVLIGLFNIYAAVYDEDVKRGLLDLSLNSGKQFLWMGLGLLIIIVILSIDFRFYNSFAYAIYAGIMLLLILVLIFGKEVAGSKSWFEIGSFRLQPAEFAKFATALALAKYMSGSNFKFERLKDLFITFAILFTPVLLIMLQGDTGTALVFGAFFIMFYREGFWPQVIAIGLISAAIFVLTLLVNEFYLYIGILLSGALLILFGKRTLQRIVLILSGMLLVASVIIGVDYFIENILKPHQQNRVKALINPEADPLGYGWNVTQSKIAIGSGGVWGKGFLQGTQTKFDFVPEQSTDFIFCTLGEEQGWFGSLALIMIFMMLLFRIVILAERQKSKFARIYGYSVASLIFFHYFVNIGMTIGLFPVIGIPLPFISYGGSSLWAFTILLFIFIKLDAHRMQVLLR